MDEAPAIDVRDVCFAYGGNEVLHNVSFGIPHGAFVAVIGPNGGGKTTLLRLLLGDLAPLFGEVRVLGGAPAAARRRVGFVPQQIAFDPDFPATVLEAVMLGRVADRLFGGFSLADREAAREALGRVGLADFGDRPFAALSGGQRQRVAIAQALAAGPELLLLDEPTANVDPATEADLYALFSKLAGDGRTLVVVSHNLSVVAARATHLLCVNRTADLHELGADGEATLEPLAALGADLALVHTLHPDHVKALRSALGSPHRGEHGCAHHHEEHLP